MWFYLSLFVLAGACGQLAQGTESLVSALIVALILPGVIDDVVDRVRGPR